MGSTYNGGGKPLDGLLWDLGPHQSEHPSLGVWRQWREVFPMSGTLAWSKLEKKWEKGGEMACGAGC